MSNEPGLRVPVFAVIDLDRTLIDTNLFVDSVWRLLPSLGMNHVDIEALKNSELSQRGRQFDLIAEIASRLSEPLDADEFAARIISDKDAASIVYDGVSNLFSDLKEGGIPAAIMTYGGQLSQLIKLQILARSLENEALMPPATIVSHQEKARWLSGNALVAEEGGRIVPSQLSGGVDIIADRIVVIDDKQHNLETNAEDIEGILIDNHTETTLGRDCPGIKIGELSAATLLTRSS